MAIANQQLRNAFLSPPMRHYFEAKLSPLSPREVRVRVEEALKFLNMAAYCHSSIPVSKDIDEIWHLWILETQEYRKLCRILQGGRVSASSLECLRGVLRQGHWQGGNDLKSDVAMLATYVLNYGPFRKDRIKYWRLAAHLVDKCGWSVRQLNGWLASANGATRP